MAAASWRRGVATPRPTPVSSTYCLTPECKGAVVRPTTSSPLARSRLPCRRLGFPLQPTTSPPIRSRVEPGHQDPRLSASWRGDGRCRVRAPSDVRHKWRAHPLRDRPRRGLRVHTAPAQVVHRRVVELVERVDDIRQGSQRVLPPQAQLCEQLVILQTEVRLVVALQMLRLTQVVLGLVATAPCDEEAHSGQPGGAKGVQGTCPVKQGSRSSQRPTAIRDLHAFATRMLSIQWPLSVMVASRWWASSAVRADFSGSPDRNSRSLRITPMPAMSSGSPKVTARSHAPWKQFRRLLVQRVAAPVAEFAHGASLEAFVSRRSCGVQRQSG